MNKDSISDWSRWHMPTVLTIMELRQGHQELEANHGYISPQNKTNKTKIKQQQQQKAKPTKWERWHDSTLRAFATMPDDI